MMTINEVVQLDYYPLVGTADSRAVPTDESFDSKCEACDAAIKIPTHVLKGVSDVEEIAGKEPGELETINLCSQCALEAAKVKHQQRIDKGQFRSKEERDHDAKIIKELENIHAQMDVLAKRQPLDPSLAEVEKEFKEILNEGKAERGEDNEKFNMIKEMLNGSKREILGASTNTGFLKLKQEHAEFAQENGELLGMIGGLAINNLLDVVDLKKLYSKVKGDYTFEFFTDLVDHIKRPSNHKKIEDEDEIDRLINDDDDDDDDDDF